jgi:hypothetical protein
LPAGTGGMAGFAQIRGNRMRSRFISGVGADMTRSTGVCGLTVIKWQHKSDPARPRGMAQLTGISGDRMRSRFVSGVRASVTCTAAIGGLCVIKRQYEIDPSRTSGVAQLTCVCSHRMCRRFVGGIGAYVTAGAGIRGLIVWEWHDQRYPYIGRMTGFTQFCCLGVRRGLIRPGAHTVMTTRAIAGLTCHCRVIKYNL